MSNEVPCHSHLSCISISFVRCPREKSCAIGLPGYRRCRLLFKGGHRYSATRPGRGDSAIYYKFNIQATIRDDHTCILNPARPSWSTDERLSKRKVFRSLLAATFFFIDVFTVTAGLAGENAACSISAKYPRGLQSRLSLPDSRACVVLRVFGYKSDPIRPRC